MRYFVLLYSTYVGWKRPILIYPSENT